MASLVQPSEASGAGDSNSSLIRVAEAGHHESNHAYAIVCSSMEYGGKEKQGRLYYISCKMCRATYVANGLSFPPCSIVG